MRTEAEYAKFEKFFGKEAVDELKASDVERDEKLEEIRSLKEALLQMNAADVGNAFKQVLADDLNICCCRRRLQIDHRKNKYHIEIRPVN